MAALRHIASYGKRGMVCDLPIYPRRLVKRQSSPAAIPRRAIHMNAKAQELKSGRRVPLSELVSNECQSSVRSCSIGFKWGL